MTKVLIPWKNEEKKENKKIEFCGILDGNLKIIDGVLESGMPNHWAYVELVCLEYTNKYDLMLAYNDPNNRGGGTLFYGHFNDGIV